MVLIGELSNRINMATTYTLLFNQILSWLNRDDLGTRQQVPNFINQAQQRICRDIKNIGLVEYVSDALTPSINIYPQPSLWRRNITFYFNRILPDASVAEVPLLFRSYEFVKAYWPSQAKTGIPRYYAVMNFTNFIIAPTPNAAYPFTYAYVQTMPRLNENNQTNWLTNYAADILLYASLLESAPFVKDDNRVATWEKAYQERIAALNQEDSERKIDRQQVRNAD